jgi:hypothetical protein
MCDIWSVQFSDTFTVPSKFVARERLVETVTY